VSRARGRGRGRTLPEREHGLEASVTSSEFIILPHYQGDEQGADEEAFSAGYDREDGLGMYRYAMAARRPEQDEDPRKRNQTYFHKIAEPLPPLVSQKLLGLGSNAKCLQAFIVYHC
jgi:hypothetical protein